MRDLTFNLQKTTSQKFVVPDYGYDSFVLELRAHAQRHGWKVSELKDRWVYLFESHNKDQCLVPMSANMFSDEGQRIKEALVAISATSIQNPCALAVLCGARGV